MNKIKLDNAGGLHFYQDALAYMHNAAREAILQLSKAVGNNAIVEGCEVAGGNISNGIVVIDNEIMPFEGGTNFGFIAVSEVAANEDFEDGTPKQVYFTRKAISAVSGIPVADFKRITPLKDIINAKSDSYRLDDTNTLATSKAVRNLWASIGILGYYNENITIDPTAGDFWYPIAHNLNLSTYNILPSYRIELPTGVAPIYNIDPLTNFRNIGPNSFEVHLLGMPADMVIRLSFLFLKY